ncbi:hypothetical protein LP419_29110 [Massilia sp. H-1]|nr:hypothetical protein LP419_29110 [Massilia sp. H-1]
MGGKAKHRADRCRTLAHHPGRSAYQHLLCQDRHEAAGRAARRAVLSAHRHGPCVYSGRDMVASHDEMGVKAAHFNALAEDLQIAMEKRQVQAPQPIAWSPNWLR